ncbi:exported hypothetical protein [Azospirillaceae bacterium]
MRVLLATVLMLLGLLAGVPAARAQAPLVPHSPFADRGTLNLNDAEALRRARNELALYYYGSRYTIDVLTGVALGGAVMSILVGGPSATIAGSAAGAMIGIVWFFDGYAEKFLERRGWE